jgi:hypothetical protein
MLVRALERVFEQRAAEETSVGGYVTTRFTEAVYSVCQYAIKRRRIGVIVAAAGAGKSMVLQAVQEDTPGSILITVRQRRATPKSFLQIWARELGLQEFGRAEDIQDRIMGCLTATDRLVLIDEAHKLTVATLDVIREIWDQVHCPIVMAGTPSFYQTLTSRRAGVAATELMDQLYSRMGIYRNLVTLQNPQTGDPEPLFTAEDIRKVFARGHVRLTKDGVDFLCKLANHPGAGCLRICADLVQMVVDLYPDRDVSAALLNAALTMRVGTAEAGFTLNKAGLVLTPEAPARAAG